MKRNWFLSLFVNVAVCCVLSGQTQKPVFSPADPVAVGDGSGHLVFGDVNGDGKPDLIAQHLQQRVITVQLGDGSGRFAAAPGSPIKLPYSPGDVKVGDVNNDGMPDLGVTNSERDTVDIFLGDGSGKFTRAPGSPFVVSASTEFNTQTLQLLDINEDRNLDIIATDNRRNSLATSLGNGRGGFAPGSAVSFPANAGRYTFAFGDLDGDGHLDAVVTNSGDEFDSNSSRVVVLRGDGKGNFKNFSETSVLAGPRFVTLGDINGDQRPDLVFTHNNDRLSVLLNQRDGKFMPGPAYDLAGYAFGVAVVDINGDKQNDLVVATMNSVTALLNGKSGFSPAPGSPFRAGPGAYFLAVGDVNRDGKPDVAASSFEGKTVTVLLGR
jgi:hypothetical protein